MTYLYVAFGSAFGGMARYACSVWIASWANTFLPWGTLAVNVIGSGTIGALLAVTERHNNWMSADTRNFLMVGVLGGFTTFSSFSMQTLELMRAQQWWQAGANVVLSVGLCLVAVSLGYWLAAK